MEEKLITTALLILPLLMSVGATATPKERRNTTSISGQQECTSVTNNIVVHGNGGTSGPPGPAGPAGPVGPAGEQGPPGTGGGGTTYIRWGRITCPNTTGTTLVYKGIASGSKYNQGGGVDFLCLPEDPEFLQFTAGQQTWRTKLYGAEYDLHPPAPAYNNVFNHHVPCAVCYTPNRGTMLRIPAKVNCPTSWTREYYGYLMSHASRHPQRYTFECMDVNPIPRPGNVIDTNGAVFYFTETTCIGIPCGPYADGKEIPCVVCTK